MVTFFGREYVVLVVLLEQLECIGMFVTDEFVVLFSQRLYLWVSAMRWAQ